MRHRLLAVILTLTLLLSAFGAAGCGSSGGHRIGNGHHAVLKSVAGAVIVHHFLKKRGSKHALLKSAAAGGAIHHFVKKR